MKGILHILLILTTVVVFTQSHAQRINYSEVKRLTEAPKSPVVEYVSKSGHSFKIGDSLLIGVPSAGKAFVFIEDFPVNGSTIRRLKFEYNNTKTQILNLRVDRSQKWGYRIIVRGSGKNNVSDYLIDLEGALLSGEVVFPNTDALSKLKRAKEKLDLGLITQAEYDELKESLREEIE